MLTRDCHPTWNDQNATTLKAVVVQCVDDPIPHVTIAGRYRRGQAPNVRTVSPSACGKGKEINRELPVTTASYTARRVRGFANSSKPDDTPYKPTNTSMMMITGGRNHHQSPCNRAA